jgi:hypothetical protein
MFTIFKGIDNDAFALLSFDYAKRDRKMDNVSYEPGKSFQQLTMHESMGELRLLVLTSVCIPPQPEKKES